MGDTINELKAEILLVKAEFAKSKEDGDRELTIINGTRLATAEKRLATAEKRLATAEESALLDKQSVLLAGKGSSKAKRPRMDVELLQNIPVDEDLLTRINRYCLFYVQNQDTYKRCAIPLSKKLALTFWHGENKTLKIGDTIEIKSSMDVHLNVMSRVIKIIPELDSIIIQSENHNFCEKDLILETVEPRMGMIYLMMGHSVMHGGTNHQSSSMGIVTSGLTSRIRYLGTSGSFKGDSGASCWTTDGKLIAMQVEVEVVQHTIDKRNRPASPTTGGRCSLVPIFLLKEYIKDLLPQVLDEIETENE